MSQDKLFTRDPEVRRRRGRIFERLAFSATIFGVVILGVLLVGVLIEGLPWLTSTFLNSYPSRFPERAGFFGAIFGSLWVIGLTALLSVPIGIAAGLYLEEFSRQGRMHRFLEVLIANLAAVPSILYGILGLVVFVRMFSIFEEGTTFLGIPLPFGRSVIAGSLTLTLLVLPVIIIATREALRGVPAGLRQAAYGVGATKWQCARHHVLPAAAPGILTGVILALSRALGETAPLIMIGALTYVAFVPESPADPFTAMPIQIFNWASRFQADFHSLAAAGIIVLLAFLLSMNAIAILLRNYAEDRQMS
ncbi:MAG: phosphate ABC transporter permease PstA [Planctomycetota bacterium]|jgi:phosphate transport system permease protein